MMAYDTVDSYPMLTGGVNTSSNGTTYHSDTWSFTGGLWHPIAATFGVGRAFSAIANDPTSGDRYVLNFGGVRADGVNGFSWTYKTNVWTAGVQTGEPSGRFGDPMAYDAADGYDMLFGGCTAGTNATTCTAVSGLTARFSSGVWSSPAITGTPPSPRYAASMTYDAVDGAVVLFGGINAANQPLNDTFEYKGGAWTNITATAGPAPPPRGWATMFYDQVGDQAVLFGGCDGNPNTPSGLSACALGDTWGFSGGKWYQLSVSSAPSPRYGMPGENSTVPGSDSLTFGGVSGIGVTENDTWVFGVPLSPMVAAVPSTVDVGVSVHFSTSVTGGNGPFNFTWNFGDGTQGWGQSVNHTYASPGHPYAVSVLVRDSVGERASTVTTVTVNPLPRLTIEASTTAPQVGQNITFGETVSGGTAPFGYLWQFGDSTTSTTASTYHTYSAVGTYQVNLTVTDTYGKADNVSIMINVTSIPPLVVSVIATPHSGTIPLTAYFLASASGGRGPYAYSWIFGDGSTSLAQAPSHRYLGGGTYEVSSWVNDSVGASVLDHLSIDAFAPISVVLGLSANPVTPGTQVNITATASGGNGTLTYGWTLNTSAILETASSFNVTPAHPGSYTYEVTVVDTSGDRSNATVTLVVVPRQIVLPLKAVAEATPSNGLTPLVVSFSGSASGGTAPYSYNWTFGDGGTSTTLNTSHTYSTIGTYTSVLTVIDSLGHEATSSIVIDVFAPLTVSVGLSANPVTIGTQVNVTATTSGGNGALTYGWTLNASAISETAASFTVTPVHGGSYTYAVTVADSRGDRSTASVTLDEVPHQGGTPLKAVGRANPSSGPSPLEVEFSGTVSGGTAPYSYDWAFGDGGTSTVLNVTHTYDTAATYTAIFTAIDSIGSEAISSVSVVVTSPQPVLSSVTVDPQSANLSAGGVQVLNAVVVCSPGPCPTSGISFAWSVANSSLGSVAPASGDVTAFTAGSVTGTTVVTVTATMNGKEVAGTATMKIVSQVTSSTTSSSIPSIFWLALLVIALVVALAVGLVIGRRKKRAKEAGPQGKVEKAQPTAPKEEDQAPPALPVVPAEAGEKAPEWDESKA
jgi:PKD repeat protein